MGCCCPHESGLQISFLPPSVLSGNTFLHRHIQLWPPAVRSSWQFRIKHPVVQWMLWHSCIYRHLQLDLMGYQKRDLKLGGDILEKIYGELEEENGSRYDHISLPTCVKIFKKKRLVILAPASKLLASSYGHGGNSNRSHSNQSRSHVHMYVNNIILRSQL